MKRKITEKFYQNIPYRDKSCTQRERDFLFSILWWIEFLQWILVNELDTLKKFNPVYLLKEHRRNFFVCWLQAKYNMSCTRPPNFLLRKQKSLVCESVCQSTAINTRERRLRLQKQFSVDQSRDVVNSHRSINTSNQLKNGNVVNNSWGGNSSSPEASLRIFTAIKTKSQQNHGCEPNDECVFYFFWFDIVL